MSKNNIFCPLINAACKSEECVFSRQYGGKFCGLAYLPEAMESLRVRLGDLTNVIKNK